MSYFYIHVDVENNSRQRHPKLTATIGLVVHAAGDTVEISNITECTTATIVYHKSTCVLKLKLRENIHPLLALIHSPQIKKKLPYINFAITCCKVWLKYGNHSCQPHAKCTGMNKFKIM